MMPIAKPVCVRCDSTTDPWSYDYLTGICSTCIEKAKRLEKAERYREVHLGLHARRLLAKHGRVKGGE